MFDFDFYNPTHIVFGKDRLNEIDEMIPEDSRVMILYGGGSVKKYGTLDKVKEALGNRYIVEFAGIEPNPKFETMMKAVEQIKEEDIDFLLAVGGGSVIDGTKFATIAAMYEGPAEDLLKEGFAMNNAEEAIPMGTVLTLPATGSEMNSGAVISYGDGKYPVFSPLCFPEFSFVDPTLTFTLPQKQVANGIVDAFIHTVEQYVTYPAEGRFQDRVSEGILQTLMEIGKKTIEDPNDYDARANLVWCATMALNGLIGAGVPQDWSIHMIGHEITSLYKIDHGRTLAIVLPALWDVRRDKKKDKIIQYANRVLDIKEGSENEIIDLAIEKTRDFFESLGIKTKLSDYGLTEKDVDAIVKGLEKRNRTALSETRDLDLETSRKILLKAL